MDLQENEKESMNDTQRGKLIRKNPKVKGACYLDQM